MADKDNQSVTTSKRVVYDLDAIGNVTVPDLGLAMASISTAIGPALQQMTNFEATLEAFIRPIREMLDSFQEFIRTAIQPALDGFNAMAKSLSFLFSTKPIYFVPSQPVVQERRLERHLMVQNDDYGFFVIDGKQLTILHPASSRCGKLLAALLKHRSRVVDYKTLRQEIGSKDLDKTFKDLKYQLKQEGIVLDYARPRSYGIALTGLKALQ
ncbi:MAG TPA: hypothetical protein VMR18_01785 [Candidatus Saccharimonadales bacterium]|nr:hypothetical protein [Candidatus Saccharimonadales bacterium]